MTAHLFAAVLAAAPLPAQHSVDTAEATTAGAPDVER
jgi:hypothetical protein